MSIISRSLKRIQDIFLSLVLLVPGLLLTVIVAVAIKLDSQGPVFFKQTRLGKNNKPFSFYKFRTMFCGADKEKKRLSDKNEANGFLFKMKKDLRETKFGRFLRGTGLDELPQLINVLKGEMSLVGPRPLPINDVSEKALGGDQELIQQWQKRQQALPGITGLWQVSLESKGSFQAMLRLDNQYIDQSSIFLDLKIILATIKLALTALRPKLRAKRFKNSDIKEQKKGI